MSVYCNCVDYKRPAITYDSCGVKIPPISGYMQWEKDLKIDFQISMFMYYAGIWDQNPGRWLMKEMPSIPAVPHCHTRACAIAKLKHELVKLNFRCGLSIGYEENKAGNLRYNLIIFIGNKDQTRIFGLFNDHHAYQLCCHIATREHTKRYNIICFVSSTSGIRIGIGMEGKSGEKIDQFPKLNIILPLRQFWGSNRGRWRACWTSAIHTLWTTLPYCHTRTHAPSLTSACEFNFR